MRILPAHIARRAERFAPPARAVRWSAAAVLLLPGLLLAGNPHRSEHFLRRGIAALEAGEFGKAEDLFLRARRADPVLPQPEIMLGHLAMAQARYDDAETAFQTAIELHRDLKSNLRRENARAIQREKDNLEVLETALAATENDAGRARAESRRLQREAEKTRRERKLDKAELPEEEVRIPGELFLFLGNARLRAGRPESAVGAYQEAVNRLPEAPEPHHNLAVALAQSRRIEEALEECRRAEKLGYAESARLRWQIESMRADPPEGSDSTGPVGSPD